MIKYSYLLIKVYGEREIIDCQNLLFSLGFNWQSGDSEPLYYDQPDLMLYVNLDLKTIGKSRICQYYQDTRYYDEHYIKRIILSYGDDIDDIINIIKYDKILPSYKPKKRIERTLESNYEKLNEGWFHFDDNNSVLNFKGHKPKFKIGDEVILKPNSLEIHKRDINDYYYIDENTINWISENQLLKNPFKIITMAYSPEKDLWILFLHRNPDIFISENSVTYYKPSYEPKEKPKRLLENNIQYPYRFKTKEEFIKDYGDHEFGSSRNRIGWRYGGGLMKNGSFSSGMDYLLGQPYPYNININDYEDGIGNRNLPNLHGWTIEKFMLTRNIKEPTYEPKEKPKRLLENNIEPSLVLNPEQQEDIFTVGKIFKIREDAFDYSFDVCSNMKEYLGKRVKIIKINKLKHIYYDQSAIDLYIKYPYNKESNPDDLIITVEKIDDINDNGRWYWYYRCFEIVPSYEPKKRIERTLEKLNEDYTFINDNEKLKRINFDYLIGDSVIIRYDALDLHLNNILWSEDSQTISFIKNNIGKRFIVEEVAYCTDNHQYYLKIEVGKGLKMWIYSGSVKSIEPNYKPKEKPKRLLEEVIFNGESDFRVWCDTIEKSKEFEDLLYKRGWKWDTLNNTRIEIDSKMMFLFFMHRKRFDSYGHYLDDGLKVYEYPKDLNKIFSLLNPSPSYKPKGLSKRTLD